jgi:hypothetical protein
MLFERRVVGRSRTWAHICFDKYIFLQDAKPFYAKKYRIRFFGSGRFRDTPGGWI